jgi:hypothetical protein
VGGTCRRTERCAGGGAVDLFSLSLRQRADALIGIAHPASAANSGARSRRRGMSRSAADDVVRPAGYSPER